MSLKPRIFHSLLIFSLFLISARLSAAEDYSAGLFDINRTEIVNGQTLNIHPNLKGAGTAVAVVDYDAVWYEDPRFGNCAKPPGALDHRGWVPTGSTCKIAWVMCVAVATQDPPGTGNVLPTDLNRDYVNDAIVPCTYQDGSPGPGHGTEVAAGVVAVAPDTKIVALDMQLDSAPQTYPAIYRWLHTPGTAYSAGNYLQGQTAEESALWAQDWTGRFGVDSPAQYFDLVAVNGSFAYSSYSFSEHCAVTNPQIPQSNSDSDRFLDIQDNCTLAANEVYDPPPSTPASPGFIIARGKVVMNADGDGDGYGNVCDGDFDNLYGANGFTDWAVFVKAKDLYALIKANVPAGADARQLGDFACDSPATSGPNQGTCYTEWDKVSLADQVAFNQAHPGVNANFDLNADGAIDNKDRAIILSADIDWDKDIDTADSNLAWPLVWKTAGPSSIQFNAQNNVPQNLKGSKFLQDKAVLNPGWGGAAAISMAGYYDLGAELAALRALGVVPAFAAANGAISNGVGFPACMQDAVAVSGVTPRGPFPTTPRSGNEAVTYFSPKLTTIAASSGAASYATPLVAGAVAVIQSARIAPPPPALPLPALSVSEVIARLRQTRRQAWDNRMCSGLGDRSLAIGCVAEPNGQGGTTWLGYPGYSVPLLDLKEALKEASAYSGDADNDGIFNELDNCVHYANHDQRDSDGDGYGTTCDADLAGPNLPGTAPYQYNWYGNGIVDWTDSQSLYSMYGTVNPHGNLNGDVDADGNAIVDSADLSILMTGGVRPPGYYSGSNLRSGLDADQDGTPYSRDRCLDVPNGPWVNSATSQYAQYDTDEDGYGNICDADFDNDKVVTWYDHMLVTLAVQNGNADLVYDVTGDLIVNQADVDKVGQLKLISAIPGPSGMTH